MGKTSLEINSALLPSVLGPCPGGASTREEMEEAELNIEAVGRRAHKVPLRLSPWSETGGSPLVIAPLILCHESGRHSGKHLRVCCKRSV
jgi:hypothetical protein